MDWSRMREAKCEYQRFWRSQALFLAEHLSQLELDVITHIVARLPYSIFQTQYIFQPDLLHVRSWDEQFWWIIIMLVDYCTLPCQDWVLGHSDFRTYVAIYVIFRAVIDAQFYVNSFSLDRWCLRWIAWLWLSILYCVMVIISLILIFVTCINLWYHDPAVIIIWTWLYLVLCIDVLT